MRLVRLLAVLAVVLGLLPAATAVAQSDGEAVRGVIRQDAVDGGERAPVEGVDVIVSTPDGEEVGTGTSDAEGAFEVPLPGPGEYTAEVDTASLPDGVTLRNPEPLSFEVAPGQSRPLLFPLGEGAGGGSGFVRQALQLGIEGIKLGLIIAMCAIGLSLIFGTTGLTNFAHGELVTFGAIVAYTLNVTLGLPLLVSAVGAIVIGGLAGGALDRVLWRPLRQRGTGLIAMLVISIGLSLLLRYLFLFQFGGRTRPFAVAVQQGVQVGPISIAPRDVLSIILSVVVLVAVGLLLQRSRLGKAMRAVADNKDLAKSSGIDAEGVVNIVWIAGGGLATLGGILLGLSEQISWVMGFQLLLLMFAGVTLGGLGTAFGAFLGSLIIGLFVQMSTLFISPELKNVGALLVLVLILLVRPQGILGRAERVG